jgi:hypothetical protein
MEKLYKISANGKEEFTPEEYDYHAAMMQEMAAVEYRNKRSLEYPDYRDYLDGIVKNDQAQIQTYIDACLAVKAKYPKPE